MMKWMLTCEQVASEASDFVDGGGSWTARVRVRVHLAMCDGCREYIRQMTLVIGALRALPRRLPDAAVRARLLGVFRAS